MTRRIVSVISAMVTASIGAGCTGNPPDLTQPPGRAAELSGAWRVLSVSGEGSCLIIDETGALTNIRGDGQAAFGADGLVLDGKWRPLSLPDAPDNIPIEYAAVGEATLIDSTARIQTMVTMRMFGFSVATMTITIEGTYDGSRIVGTSTNSAVSHVPGLPLPEPEVTGVEYVRSDCSPGPPEASPIRP